jgi:hypothetical protein
MQPGSRGAIINSGTVSCSTAHDDLQEGAAGAISAFILLFWMQSFALLYFCREESQEHLKGV